LGGAKESRQRRFWKHWIKGSAHARGAKEAFAVDEGSVGSKKAIDPSAPSRRQCWFGAPARFWKYRIQKKCLTYK
jgi:hypothetical protein